MEHLDKISIPDHTEWWIVYRKDNKAVVWSKCYSDNTAQDQLTLARTSYPHAQCFKVIVNRTAEKLEW